MDTTTIFTTESIPEKNLKRIRKYRAFISSEETQRILDTIYPGPIPNNIDVQINTEVVIREYKEPESLNKNEQYNGIG